MLHRNTSAFLAAMALTALPIAMTVTKAAPTGLATVQSAEGSLAPNQSIVCRWQSAVPGQRTATPVAAKFSFTTVDGKSAVDLGSQTGVTSLKCPRSGTVEIQAASEALAATAKLWAVGTVLMMPQQWNCGGETTVQFYITQAVPVIQGKLIDVNATRSDKPADYLKEFDFELGDDTHSGPILNLDAGVSGAPKDGRTTSTVLTCSNCTTSGQLTTGLKITGNPFNFQNFNFSISGHLQALLKAIVQLPSGTVDYEDTFTTPLLSMSLAGYSIPGIINLGPSFNLKLSAHLKLLGRELWKDLGFTLDAQQIDVTANLLTRNVEVRSWNPVVAPLSLDLDELHQTAQPNNTATKSLSSLVDLHLVPGISVGITFLGQIGLSVGLSLDAYAQTEVDLIWDNKDVIPAPVDAAALLERRSVPSDRLEANNGSLMITGSMPFAAASPLPISLLDTNGTTACNLRNHTLPEVEVSLLVGIKAYVNLATKTIALGNPLEKKLLDKKCV